MWLAGNTREPLRGGPTFKHALPALWYAAVSGQVRLLEWHIDADFRLQEQRHLQERAADGGWFDVGALGRARRVGRQCQRLSRRKLEAGASQLGPDGSVNPFRIASRGREETDDQEV